MRLGRTTFIHFGSQVVISVSGFVATLLIARLLGPAGLGKYAIAVALGYFWLAIPGNAVSNAVTKRVSEGIDPESYLTSGFLLNAIIGAVILLLVVALTPWVNQYVGASVSPLVAALAAVTILSSTVFGGLSGQKKVAETGLLNAFERLGRTGFQVGFLVLGWGVAGLIIGHVASLVLAGVVGLLLYEMKFGRPDSTHFTSLLEYAKYAWLSPLRGRVFGWLDVIILAFFVAPNLIGIYEAAWGLASLLGMISVSIRSTLFPELSDLSIDEDFGRVKHYLNEGLVFSGIFVIPGLFGAAVLGTQVLRIYREEFTRGAIILVILILAYVAEVYGAQLVNAINAVDRPDVAFRVNAVFIFTNLILNLWLISVYGWYGAAVATAVSTTVMMILGYYMLTEVIGSFDIPVREIALEIIAAGLMASVVYAMDSVTPEGIGYTVAMVFIGAGVYSVILIGISGRIRRKSLSLLDNLVHQPN